MISRKPLNTTVFALRAAVSSHAAEVTAKDRLLRAGMSDDLEMRMDAPKAASAS